VPFLQAEAWWLCSNFCTYHPEFMNWTQTVSVWT